MITTVLAMIFTLGLVVLVHELGHFLAARSAGIHVHRFSIGLGPVLLRWRGFGTEWALSLLPFGGYVKMAGMLESVGEGETPPEEALLPPDRLYRNRPIPVRLWAIVAGPLANLLLAVALSTGIYAVQGFPIIPDVILSAPPADTPAARAGVQRGDRVVELNGEAVANWNEFAERLSEGGAADYRLTIERSGERRELVLALTASAGRFDPTGLSVLSDNRVGRVLRNGPADRLGLATGDRILELDGRPMAYFDEIAAIVNASPGRALDIVWERAGQRRTGSITPELAQVPDPADEDRVIEAGRIYFEPYSEGTEPIGLLAAAKYGSLQVLFTARKTLEWVGKQITFRGSKDAVGGPILIAKVAGEMARWGWDRLLGFIAFFSTQLFLLNLLPVPVLDGGHVVFLLLEAVGLPVREQWRLRLTMVGMALLLGLMLFILVLDLGRVLP
ncbi:RIP metalloprotease RseP [bacterium]|nr:RIP metalloprotease RseP [bacterium]